MKKLVAGLTIALVIAMVAIVYAQGHGMMGRMGMMKRNGCGMMGEMKGGMMHHENMETALPPSGSNEEMPEMEHN